MSREQTRAELVAAYRQKAQAPLQLVRDEDDPTVGMPAPAELAADQIERAIQRGREDRGGAPPWAWATCRDTFGPMLPGELIIVGAIYGNGKTSFLFSQMDHFARQGVGTLYLPLEVEPEDIRRRWAAWKLGLDPVAVARNEWHRLPSGSREAHEEAIIEQGRDPRIQFTRDRRVTLGTLARWVRWGVEKAGVGCVMIDHIHRMDFGQSSGNYRVQVSEAIRAVKDIAVRHQIPILAAAQLNHHDGDALDRYHPPSLRRLKESSALGEEADVVLMLSRRLKGLVSKADLVALKAGFRSDRDFAMPNTMAVTCRKHRLADEIAGDRTVLLHVEKGRVTDPPPDPYDHRAFDD